MACPEEAIARCVNRAERWTSLRSIWSLGSKPRTSQANLVVSRVASNPSMGAAPLRPSTRPSQYSSTVLPSGFSVPMPVTTTRLPSRLIPGSHLPVSRLASLPERPPNLTDEIRLDRLLRDPDGVLHRAGIRASVCDHRDPLDAQEWGAAELAPVHTRSDAANAA